MNDLMLMQLNSNLSEHSGLCKHKDKLIFNLLSWTSNTEDQVRTAQLVMKPITAEEQHFSGLGPHQVVLF